MENLHGQIFALYLFDVAEAADLQTAASAIGGSVRATVRTETRDPCVRSDISSRRSGSKAAAVDRPVDGRIPRRLQAVRLRHHLAAADARVHTARGPSSPTSRVELVENEALEQQAEQACRGVAERLKHGADRAAADAFSPRTISCSRSPSSSRAHTADDLVEHHGDVIASVLRGERAALSRQERDEMLRHRLSYLADDLVIPTWNAAFVYDTPAGTQAAVEIAEFANSQLLQFRYYDELLDNALARIYADRCRRSRAGTTR